MKTRRGCWSGGDAGNGANGGTNVKNEMHVATTTPADGQQMGAEDPMWQMGGHAHSANTLWLDRP